MQRHHVIADKPRHLHGWKRQPVDARDAVLRTGVWKRLTCPPTASLRRRWVRIEDQGDLGYCFPAGTLISMADNTERPIEQVVEGNKVYAHDGQTRRVTKAMKRVYTGLMYSVTVRGWPYPISSTDEHPYAVVENVSKRAKHGDFEPGSLRWVKAQDLKPGDFLLMTAGKPVEAGRDHVDLRRFMEEDIVECGDSFRIASASKPVKTRILMSERFSRLIGLFLAEGSYRKSETGTICGLSFSFARSEVDYQNFVVEALRDLFGADANCFTTDAAPSVAQVRCDNATLGRFFHKFCGEYAAGKFVNPLFFSCDLSVRLALIRGWLQGDGSHDPLVMSRSDGKERTAIQLVGVTSSERLHRDFFRLSLTCGMKPSGGIRKQADHQNHPGRTLVFYSNDALTLFPELTERVREAGIMPTGRTWWRKHDLGYLCRVTSIEVCEADEVEVFNFEVEEEHSYIANCIAVHNCVFNSTTSCLEYLHKKAGMPEVQFSRLFAGYMTRVRLEGVPPDEDSGAFIRDALKAYTKWGVCSEKLWPYDITKFPVEPPASARREALEHQLLLSSGGQPGYSLLTSVADMKACIAAGYPFAGGFDCPESLTSEETAKTGVVRPFRRGEATIGGHAVAFTGYGMAHDFGLPHEYEKLGLLLEAANSWSERWGRGGFLYLPASYFAEGKLDDCQTMRLLEGVRAPRVSNGLAS